MEERILSCTTDTMYQEGRYYNIDMEQQFYIERKEENCVYNNFYHNMIILSHIVELYK